LGEGGGLKCFKEKKKYIYLFYFIFIFKKNAIPPSPNVGWWLCRIPRWLLRGGGGIEMFQEKEKIIINK
jgi:hypothetical protein